MKKEAIKQEGLKLDTGKTLLYHLNLRNKKDTCPQVKGLLFYFPGGFWELLEDSLVVSDTLLPTLYCYECLTVLGTALSPWLGPPLGSPTFPKLKILFP